MNHVTVTIPHIHSILVAQFEVPEVAWPNRVRDCTTCVAIYYMWWVGSAV